MLSFNAFLWSLLRSLWSKQAKKMMEPKWRHRKRDVMSQINLHLFRIILLNRTKNQLQHFSFLRGARCFISIWRLLFICLFWDKVWVVFAFRLGNGLKFRILMHWYDEFVFMSSRGWVRKHSKQIWMNFPLLKRIILLWWIFWLDYCIFLLFLRFEILFCIKSALVVVGFHFVFKLIIRCACWWNRFKWIRDGTSNNFN